MERNLNTTVHYRCGCGAEITRRFVQPSEAPLVVGHECTAGRYGTARRVKEIAPKREVFHAAD